MKFKQDVSAELSRTLAAAPEAKTPVMGESEVTAEQLRAYLRKANPNAPDYAALYLTIGRAYGVRGDLVFCQSCKETGFWRFGGQVLPEQNNFAGLGATNGGARGASFSHPAIGIEAQIQHLYCYATTADLPPGRALVDPRWDAAVAAGYRGVAPCWEDLNGRWAVPGPTYGQDIVRMWREVLAIPVTPPAPTIDWEARAKAAEDKLARIGAIIKEG